MEKLNVLRYLQMWLDGNNLNGYTTHLQYPTPISLTLNLQLINVALGEAWIKLITHPERHGNQQGTIHGGLLCELADAAIGTAHSTRIEENESFTSVDLKINFLRPVWQDTLIAHAKPIQSGKRISVYSCNITNDAGKQVAYVVSTMMTLRGEQAKGR
ncbi:PaaI family thioesterase [Chitinophaga sp.]|uniref:PaaI family thioesterase n=1 Tax=Chitinophaga sp. TaxID=1869181 RepID=UPI0031DB3884